MALARSRASKAAPKKRGAQAPVQKVAMKRKRGQKAQAPSKRARPGQRGRFTLKVAKQRRRQQAADGMAMKRVRSSKAEAKKIKGKFVLKVALKRKKPEASKTKRKSHNSTMTARDWNEEDVVRQIGSPVIPYIQSRVKKANGKTVGWVLNKFWTENTKGKTVKYRPRDLEYDIHWGYLKIESSKSKDFVPAAQRGASYKAAWKAFLLLKKGAKGYSARSALKLLQKPLLREREQGPDGFEAFVSNTAAEILRKPKEKRTSFEADEVLPLFEKLFQTLRDHQKVNPTVLHDLAVKRLGQVMKESFQGEQIPWKQVKEAIAKKMGAKRSKSGC